jgi:hypothetical protein
MRREACRRVICFASGWCARLTGRCGVVPTHTSCGVTDLLNMPARILLYNDVHVNFHGSDSLRRLNACLSSSFPLTRTPGKLRRK